MARRQHENGAGCAVTFISEGARFGANDFADDAFRNLVNERTGVDVSHV